MDAYEVQRLRQVHGLRCEYCSSLSGHTSKCYLLSAAPRELVLTGPDFDDTKYMCVVMAGRRLRWSEIWRELHREPIQILSHDVNLLYPDVFSVLFPAQN